MTIPPTCSSGRELRAQVKARRGKYFLFLTDRRVPATDNGSEREIRPSVVFRPLSGARRLAPVVWRPSSGARRLAPVVWRKLTGGFRSAWGARVHAGYRTLTSAAGTAGQTAWQTMTGLTHRAVIQPNLPLLLPTR